MTKAKDFYSKSVTEAIRQACADFATSQEKLDIEVLETGSAGIFGLCKKRAHIRVSRKKSTSAEEQELVKPVTETKAKPKANDRKEHVEPEKTSSEPVAEEVDTSAEETVSEKVVQPSVKTEEKPVKVPAEKEVAELPSDEALASIKSNLEQILILMGFESQVSVQFDGTAVQCHISGDHEESIVGSDGRILDNMQYLIRKIASRSLPDKTMIDLDAGNFREQRVVELKEKAVELANLVKKDGKTQAIPALNPSERRVVHVTLQDDKGVRSRSVGDGIFKKVLIFKPGKGRKSGPRRRGRQGGGSANN